MPKKTKKNQFKTEEVKVFKQFKRQQIFKQITFVFAAFIVAFGINAFVLGGEMGSQLKTNVLEAGKQASSTIEKKANIYLEKVDGSDSNIMKLKLGKKMDSVKTISLSLIYNPEVVEVQDMFSNVNGLELSRIENEKGIATLILTFEKATDIGESKDVINFYVSKSEETTQHINIINSNFTDSTGTNYQLTTSGIAF